MYAVGFAVISFYFIYFISFNLFEAVSVTDDTQSSQRKVNVYVNRATVSHVG